MIRSGRFPSEGGDDRRHLVQGKPERSGGRAYPRLELKSGLSFWGRKGGRRSRKVHSRSKLEKKTTRGVKDSRRISPGEAVLRAGKKKEEGRWTSLG